MTYYHTICGLTKTKSTNADTTGNRETSHCTGCPYLLPYGQQVYDTHNRCYKLHTEGYECRMPQGEVAYNSAISGHLDDKTSCYIASLDFDFLQRVSDWIKSNYHDGELIGSFSRDKIRGVEYVSNGRYRMSIACAQNRKGMEAKADLFRTFFDEHGGRLDMTPEAEKAKIMADIKAGLESQAADPPADPPADPLEDDTDAAGKTYRDPSTDILYRVKSEPYKDSYFVEYFDRQTSALWKGIYTNGNETYVGEQKYLDALAKSRGLVLAGDDVPAEQPNPCKDCVCRDCDDNRCLQAHCDCRDRGMGCIEPDKDCKRDHPELFSGAVKIAQRPEKSEIATQNTTISAPEATLPVFDFGADASTNSVLAQCAQMFMAGRYAQFLAVKQAHDVTANHYQGSFGKFCEIIGISRDTGDRMVSVAANCGNIMIDGKPLIEIAQLSVLYAAAKPSAPAEAVEAVKAGDVTTMPEYKALLAELDRVKHEAALDRKEREDTTAAADRLLAERNAANRELGQLQDAVKRNGALLDSAEHRAKAAEARAKELESRPIDVAVQQPTEEQIAEYAHKRITDATAMLQAQVHGLQEELDNARRSADIAEDTIFDTAAAYAEQAAHMIDSIRSAFWELAQGLQSDDFDRAAEPLQAAASAIADGSWEDAEGGDA